MVGEAGLRTRFALVPVIRSIIAEPVVAERMIPVQCGSNLIDVFAASQTEGPPIESCRATSVVPSPT
jgi:hypothetical protein